MSWEDEAFADKYTCPHCHREDCVPASGPSNSTILVIGEFPGEVELKEGKPLVGPTGGIFRTEIKKFGYDPAGFRLCNLWLHTPNPKEKTYKECLQHGMDQAIKEAKGKKAILLLGSDCVKAFCNESVMDVNGLQVKSPYLSAPIIVASVNPAYVFRQGIGELRLALRRFINLVDKL